MSTEKQNGQSENGFEPLEPLKHIPEGGFRPQLEVRPGVEETKMTDAQRSIVEKFSVQDQKIALLLENQQIQARNSVKLYEVACRALERTRQPARVAWKVFVDLAKMAVAAGAGAYAEHLAHVIK